MPRLKRLIFILAILLVLVWRIFSFYNTQSYYTQGQTVKFEAMLTDEPEIKNNRQKFRIKDHNGNKITIITGLNTIYQYGDQVMIVGSINQKDYNGHLFISINFPTIQTINNDQNFITQAATRIRRYTKAFYTKNMPSISSSLLSGIVFGGNQGMPDKFMQDLKNSGVIHVIAASGMNVTFVAGALITLFGAFLKRQIALTIAIVGIIFYAFIAGFEPSIIRAAIMAVIAFSAQLLGKQNHALSAIFLTGVFMLLIQSNLLTDVGFQLSFLATLGILILKPILDASLGKLSNKKGFALVFGLIGDDIGTTIAAQLATIPILLSVFGSYGLLSVLVNMLVLWTVPILMILGALGLLFGAIFEPIGRIFLYLALPFLLYFEKVVTFFGSLNLNLTVPELSPVVWIGYYLVLISLILLIKQNRVKKSPTQNSSI